MIRNVCGYWSSCYIIVIRLKACACSYMIHTEFVCFYMSVCLCKQSEKYNICWNLFSRHSHHIRTHIVLVLPASHLTFHAVHSADLFSFLILLFSIYEIHWNGGAWTVKSDTGEERAGWEDVVELYDGVLLWPPGTPHYWRAGREAP